MEDALYKMSCGLVYRAYPHDFQRLLKTLEQDFPNLTIVISRINTDKLWLLTDYEIAKRLEAYNK